MNLMNMMDYHHFPIYSIMVLFLGAFVVAACGSKPSKNPKNPAEYSRAGASTGSSFFPRRFNFVIPVIIRTNEPKKAIRNRKNSAWRGDA